MIQTTAAAVKTTPATARLIAQVEQGYTVRMGLYIPRRGFPRGQWQLFSPAGEFVKVVDYRMLNVLDNAGHGSAIHGSMSGLKGITRRQGES